MRPPLSNLAPARRRLVLIVIGLLLLALMAGIGVLLLGKRGGAAVDQAVAGPVLVVPGYGGNAGSVTPLVAALREQGREVVVFAPDGGGTGDLREQARALATLTRITMRRTGAASVDVVGYSAGGVVARLFVRDEGGADVVRRVLTLGSPQHGTEIAALAAEVAGGCPVACEQLAPDSDLLRELNAGDETPSGPRWLTVRSTGDQVVTPTESAVLEGAVNVEVQGVCPAATTSHGQLPGDPVVLATLASGLGAAAPQEPRTVTC
ncbi:MAG: alpha/beta fold hydrolase [Marmoricola sp.]